MAEGVAAGLQDLAVTGDPETWAEEDDANFDTPPESPDDVKLDLSSRTQSELDELKATEEYIKKNQEWINRSNESVRELKATMEKLMGQTSSRTQELETRTNKIKEMKKEIDEISTEAIEKEEEELKKLIDSEKSSKPTDESKADVDNEQRVSELLMKMEAYQQKLGIQISTSQGCIEFIFTNVDAHCPDSTFSVKLALADEQYKCVSCEPPVEKTSALLEELNQHHNLQQFITALRSEFELLVNKEN